MAENWPAKAFMCFRPLGPLVGGGGWRLADTVGDRVFAAEWPPAAVVLDLVLTTEIDEEGCLALLKLHRGLTASEVQLRLAALRSGPADRLDEAGLTGRIGEDSVHPSVRVALLAAYETLPGPGVVTPAVREALSTPPECVPTWPTG